MPPEVVEKALQEILGILLYNEQPPGKPGGCLIVAFFNAGSFLLRKPYS
jgi:hypothetical protein